MQFKNKKDKVNTFLWAGIGLILLVNIAIIFQSIAAAKNKIIAAKELARPADISFIIIKDSACPDCASLDPYTNAFRKMKVNVTSERAVEIGSEEGKKIIADFGIGKVPMLIVQGEISRSAELSKLLSVLGKTENGSFVLTSPDANAPIAPYLDLATGQIKGRVGMILISDKACAECPDAKFYKQAIAGAGVINPENKGELDITDSEGAKLVKKYNITSVPTFILTGEVAEYPALLKEWPKLGTVEKDGAYVFRELKIFQGLIYFDLEKNEVVKPEVKK